MQEALHRSSVGRVYFGGEMSERTAREDWERLWARIDAESKAAKLSQGALSELSAYYLSLSTAERRVVDAVLAEWVLSDNESKRFDSLALIDAHEIRSALPGLAKLRERLGRSRAPGAPFELAKVERIVKSLS